MDNLHIGHAKSICLNFAVAAENSGPVQSPFSTIRNPSKETVEYEKSIQRDVPLAGVRLWEDRLFLRVGLLPAAL
jgi:glutaminyl-tRNA synthetase